MNIALSGAFDGFRRTIASDSTKRLLLGLFLLAAVGLLGIHGTLLTLTSSNRRLRWMGRVGSSVLLVAAFVPLWYWTMISFVLWNDEREAGAVASTSLSREQHLSWWLLPACLLVVLAAEVLRSHRLQFSWKRLVAVPGLYVGCTATALVLIILDTSVRPEGERPVISHLERLVLDTESENFEKQVIAYTESVLERIDKDIARTGRWRLDLEDAFDPDDGDESKPRDDAD